ncbi:MAG TPA: beta-propeller fold lactonase family protein [Bryobacteraceae bacterium]|nr:beta-propeller fold lactonase family protein [Bryobacteraceae bacterium]
MLGKTQAFAFFFVLAAFPLAAQVPPGAFVNFEGAQTNPVRISADGTRLFAVNTPDARLSVFDLTKPSSPKLLVEIPVGIEPVSVNINPNVPGNDEAWVVNEESDSISVVSVSKGIVTDTIQAKDEPADVVFAGHGLAFVSVARSNTVNVYNNATHALVKSIPLTGECPRALAVSPDGSTVYVAFALSGNHTTIISNLQAPPPPPPVNPALPPPPQVGLIVDASDPAWSSIIQYTMPDNDVAAISSSTLKVTQYFPHLGTVNLGLAVSPQSGDVYVANSDALNLVMFETALNGHIVNHRISSVNPTTGQSQIWDLNPNIDYSKLPNRAALASALAMPTAIVFEPAGRYLYIAAFGTDRVGIFDTTTGTVTRFIEIDPQATGATVNPLTKRGPRGLALDPSANLLYVLNRIYNTISIVNLSSNTVTAEIPTGSFDPTPVVIRNGRGFLYDHKLSGNGTAACASCHIDAEMDLLSWDLGNPDGDMTYLQEGSNTYAFHPMKGPMTTQSLRGLANVEPYHWRGDQPNLAAFNGAFASLLGGQQLSSADMAAFTNFINTIVYQPNPNQNLDRTMPSSISLPDVKGASADPNNGLNIFVNVPFNNAGKTCNSCHPSNPGTGTDLKVLPSGKPSPIEQPVKVPHLRNMYQKTDVSFNKGAVSVNGFGFNHDGQIDGLFAQVGQNSFPLFTHNTADKEAIEAFELCFDTGMAPAVGYARTLTSANVTRSPAQTDWTTLQNQAAAGNIDLIATGTIQLQIHGLLYNPAANNYQSDATGLGPFTQAQLVGFIQSGDILTIMGVPPGSGVRMALDRNLDGVLNGDVQQPRAVKKK